MAFSFLFIILITAGGFALTYWFADDEGLLWRLAAGNVGGGAIFGTAAFVLACLFGLNVPTVLVSVVVTLAPFALFVSAGKRRVLRHDWQRAKGKLQGFNLRKSLTLAYYIFFFVVLWLFFERAMIEMPDGIYTGASHNLGDLPFHLGAIFSFTDGGNFPPINPSYAGAKFSYPFIADVLTAAFMKLGAGVENAMFVQNLAWALALLVLLDRFVSRITNERLAGKIAACLLFFSGGLGFIWFFSDYAAQATSFWDFLWHLPRDYTMGDNLSWGNSLITLFITQRSLLFGMPLAIVALDFLWSVFTKEADSEKPRLVQAAIVGGLAGCLPLIHLHSLFVLFIVAGFLLVLRPAYWKLFVVFGIGVCVIAVPELVWSIRGTASRTSQFIGWHFGWDAKDENILWFWIRNTGLLFPLLIAGILLCYFRTEPTDTEKPRHTKDVIDETWSSGDLLLFYLPFLFCFVLGNVAKLAPWEWDNVKVLIYWYVASLPFVALALVWAWQRNAGFKIVAGFCFLVFIFSGFLDVWRTDVGAINTKVFDKNAVQIAAQIKRLTPPNALFLNAPTYNTPVVLSGRISLMRFPGHLWSHGIDYGERESEVKQIFSGGPAAEQIMQKYGVNYVLFSPDERSIPGANEAYFQKYPVVAEAGQDRVFKIK